MVSKNLGITVIDSVVHLIVSEDSEEYRVYCDLKDVNPDAPHTIRLINDGEYEVAFEPLEGFTPQESVRLMCSVGPSIIKALKIIMEHENNIKGKQVATDPITAGLVGLISRGIVSLVGYLIFRSNDNQGSEEIVDLVNKVEAASSYRVALRKNRLAVNNGVKTQWMSYNEIKQLASEVLGERRSIN
jgi:hypothetical protein